MADKKKPSAPPSSSFGSIEIIFFIIIFLGISSIVVDWINKNQGFLTSFFNSISYNLINAYSKYVVFSVFLSIALFILVVIYIIKEQEIRNKIKSKVFPVKGEKKTSLKDVILVNPKWKLVLEHIGSDDANKWKLAILEADIILSELLDSLHLAGEGVGEKLKNVETSDFDHIEEAWEVHKIRNAIAHQGSDFLLTQREAKRVIGLYKLVFEEFEII
jgi:hypothetical protein